MAERTVMSKVRCDILMSDQNKNSSRSNVPAPAVLLGPHVMLNKYMCVIRKSSSVAVITAQKDDNKSPASPHWPADGASVVLERIPFTSAVWKMRG